MAAPTKRPERTRHPTLWTVEAVRWKFRQHETEYERLLAKKGEQGPGVQLGQQIAAVDIADLLQSASRRLRIMKAGTKSRDRSASAIRLRGSQP